jgi:hypothetical protein
MQLNIFYNLLPAMARIHGFARLPSQISVLLPEENMRKRIGLKCVEVMLPTGSMTPARQQRQRKMTELKEQGK